MGGAGGVKGGGGRRGEQGGGGGAGAGRRTVGMGCGVACLPEGQARPCLPAGPPAVFVLPGDLAYAAGSGDQVRGFVTRFHTPRLGFR